MVRMTDLLKKAKKQIGGKKEEPPVKKGKPAVKKEPIKPPSPEKERPPAEKPVEFSDMLLKRAREKAPLPEKEELTRKFMGTAIPSEEETKKIYIEAAEFIEKIFNTYKDSGEINRQDILNTCNKIVNNILLGSRALLKLFHEIDSLEHYIYFNAVNVNILSVEIGIAYGYNKSTLVDLAVVGLLHDIDLMKSKEVVDKPEKLDEKELEEMKKHSLNVAAYVDNAFNFKKEMVNAILQHHERKDGGGYPAGLEESDINNLAIIVGIADTYEAMTHSRPHKEKMSPHVAILEIINSGKKLFPNEAIKALVARVSLYPIGSWIQINTGEICKVLETSPESPLRPVVAILMDRDRKKFEQVRTLDLQTTPSLYIKNIVEDIITEKTKE